MKKFFLLAFFLSITSCTHMLEDIGCGVPTYRERERAKYYYNDMFTSRTYLGYEEGRKIFGCHFQRGDIIYTYKRPFEDDGYILVRGYDPIAYREPKTKKPILQENSQNKNEFRNMMDGFYGN